MTTSGRTTFNLDLNEIVEEAFERCGAELRTGYDLRTARRSLNLMTAEWANRGINLWTIEEGSIPLLKGVQSYDLPSDTIDLLEQVIRTGTGQSQNDLSISRLSASSWGSIPNKNSQGRPNQLWINRQETHPIINVYPRPNQDDEYTFVYWKMKRLDDAGKGLNTQDIPFRFLPCMVAGLAYYLSLKIPGAGDRTQFLKASYEEQWTLAADEDREKADLRIAPRAYHI
jgi:hypothetical protein